MCWSRFPKKHYNWCLGANLIDSGSRYGSLAKVKLLFATPQKSFLDTGSFRHVSRQLLLRVTKLAPVFLGLFSIAFFHHFFFYAFRFHGDSAVRQIYAEAMLDELSLLPIDFSYVTGFFVLSSHHFIALFMLLGFDGFLAFALGSSIATAVLGTILTIIMFWVTRRLWVSAFLALLTITPLGVFEFDKLLGQQSSADKFMLAVLSIFFISMYSRDMKTRWLFSAAISVAILSLTHPVHGLLTMAPLVLITLLALKWRQAILVSAVTVGGGLAGTALHEFLAVDRVLTRSFTDTRVAGFDSLTSNLLGLTRQAIRDLTGLDQISNQSVSVLSLSMYTANLIFLAVYAVLLIHGFLIIWRAGKVRLQIGHYSDAPTEWRFSKWLLAFGTAGVLSNLVITAALNPDSARHFMWATIVLKLAGLLMLAEWALDKKHPMAIFTSIFFVLALGSQWTIAVNHYGASFFSDAEKAKNSEVVRAIREVSNETGLSKVVGADYWTVLPINTLIPGVNGMQILRFDEPNFYIRAHNTRPSWACESAPVMYYVDTVEASKWQDQNDELRVLLEENGARLVHSGSDFEVWIHQPIWSIEDYSSPCYTPAFEYSGSSLAFLPSRVGKITQEGIASEGLSGFLVYGPKRFASEGSYLLSYEGKAESISNSYVEIVSDAGKNIIARKNLFRPSKGSFEGEVLLRLEEEVHDLEVRFWAGDGDLLELRSYKFRQR